MDGNMYRYNKLRGIYVVSYFAETSLRGHNFVRIAQIRGGRLYDKLWEIGSRRFWNFVTDTVCDFASACCRKVSPRLPYTSDQLGSFNGNMGHKIRFCCHRVYIALA